MARDFLDRDWIDAAPYPQKRRRLCHPVTPAVHPYLLLNYHGKVRDVMTLAHELGHGLHQILAGRQGYLQSATPLTLAETASVFGEMLVFRRLVANEKDKVRRRHMIAEKKLRICSIPSCARSPFISLKGRCTRRVRMVSFPRRNSVKSG